MRFWYNVSYVHMFYLQLSTMKEMRHMSSENFAKTLLDVHPSLHDGFTDAGLLPRPEEPKTICPTDQVYVTAAEQMVGKRDAALGISALSALGGQAAKTAGEVAQVAGRAAKVSDALQKLSAKCQVCFAKVAIEIESGKEVADVIRMIRHTDIVTDMQNALNYVSSKATYNDFSQQDLH